MTLQPLINYVQQIKSAVAGSGKRQIDEDTGRQLAVKFNQGLQSGVYTYYPASPNGRPLDRVYNGRKFKTDKQRRFVMASIRSGAIKLPYERTFRLQNATTMTVARVTGDGVAILLRIDENDAPYARYVVGAGQFYYHRKTGWPTLATALEQITDNPRFDGDVADSFNGVLRGYLEVD